MALNQRQLCFPLSGCQYQRVASLSEVLPLQVDPLRQPENQSDAFLFFKDEKA